MQNCIKCNAKIKTLYERFGASGKFEAVGYYCKRCNIFYNKDLKKAESGVRTAVADAALTVYKIEQDRIQTQACKQCRRITQYMRDSATAGI